MELRAYANKLLNVNYVSAVNNNWAHTNTIRICPAVLFQRNVEWNHCDENFL